MLSLYIFQAAVYIVGAVIAIAAAVCSLCKWHKKMWLCYAAFGVFYALCAVLIGINVAVAASKANAAGYETSKIYRETAQAKSDQQNEEYQSCKARPT